MDKIMQVEQIASKWKLHYNYITTANQAYAMCDDDIELFTTPDVG